MAGRVVGVIGVLGRRHAPQGARAALGACDAVVVWVEGDGLRHAERVAHQKLRLLVSQKLES